MFKHGFSRKSICILIFLFLFIMLLCACSSSTEPPLFSSEDAMLKALQGTYALYNNGKVTNSYEITGTNVTLTNYLFIEGKAHALEPISYSVTDINPKNGKFKIGGSVHQITSNGDISSGNKKSLYKKVTASEITDSFKTGKDFLKISQLKLSFNSVYTVCEGKITNTGNKTYKSISLKGVFKDKNGRVLDTSTDYPVGIEGLEPGESTSFTMYVKKDTSISTCSVSITDYR